MAAMRFLHLQQYSHRLNLLYVFFFILTLILRFFLFLGAFSACGHRGYQPHPV